VSSSLKQAVSDAMVANDVKFKDALSNLSEGLCKALENNQNSVAEQISNAQSVLSSVVQEHGKALGKKLRQSLDDALTTSSASSLTNQGKYL
jgi:hypothetical protein